METKEQFQKILEWLRQISRTTASVKDLQGVQDRLSYQISLLEKKMNIRIDALDERMDALSDAVQALLKAMRGIRVEQYQDRTRFQKEIQKIRQEIRELMH
jgi:predicted  nucleic acid-binding Zn-ribbon protein